MKLPTPDLQIRSVPPTDPALAAALAAADLPVVDLETSQASFYGAEVGGECVGYGGIEWLGATCLLRSLVVVPGHQAQGFGRVLVAGLLELAARRGVEAAYLLTTTASEFFVSQGFAQISRALVPLEIRSTAEFSSICPDDAVVMCRDLRGLAGG